MQYRIADLCIEYDARYPLLRERSEKYAVHVDKTALPICVTQEDIDHYRPQAPHLDDGSLEYLIMGARFYERLICFKGMLLHASAVVVDGEAYLFTAPSGTGKSTHTGLWLEYFRERAYILNDDKPAIRILNGRCFAYGTPFSGKYDISENACVPLKAIAVVERAETNSIERLADRDAIYALLNQTVRPRSVNLYTQLLQTVNILVTQVPIYKLHCNISLDAVRTSYNEMRKGNER